MPPNGLELCRAASREQHLIVLKVGWLASARFPCGVSRVGTSELLGSSLRTAERPPHHLTGFSDCGLTCTVNSKV